ncbi:DUF1963 domain-containing protein [Actinoplanes teichomyceticus]|uniref:Uncharacterized protein n=1 Tax=Actinoplanes teichomyceticus TaxID=1867 RepID=A0A561VIS5_ACTTI|nr:DUF1963 domain-containing protein [Actinoplanes teichomyceticus]TWG11516.1 hypothetical protein FHX34_106246 [Actinoplanes teichomyceticus]
MEEEAAQIAGLIEECQREIERLTITQEVLSGLVTEPVSVLPDPREQAGDPVSKPEQTDYLLEKELHRVWHDWLPLVQFDPGDDVYRGKFLIRVEDLAAHRFDQAVSFAAFLE